METKINELLDAITLLRKEAFGKDEDLYRSLGKAMGGLIDARDVLRRTLAGDK